MANKLVSMKLAPKEQKKEADITYTPPLYPYGLSISLDDEALDKLGLKELPDVDDHMTLTASVCVTSVSSNDSSGGGRRRSVSLQIEALALSDEVADDDGDDMADRLYKK